MAAASTILLAGSAAASIGMGVKKSRDASKMMEEAQRKIDGYERQVLTNTLAGVDTPYQMYEVETRQVRQRAADAAAAASEAGARGMALLPAIQDNEFEQQEVVNARLEQNLYQLKLAQAQEEQRIQQMTERREQEELAGYGALFEAGRQTKYSAAGDIIGGVQAAGGILGQAEMNRGIRQRLSNAPGTTTVAPSVQGLKEVTDASRAFVDSSVRIQTPMSPMPSLYMQPASLAEPLPNQIPDDYYLLK